MNRAEARELREMMQDAVDDIIDSCGLRLVNARARFGQCQITIAFELTEKITEDSERPTVSQQELSVGMARPGTVCWCFSHRDGYYYKAEILKSNRLRYVFQWLNYPDEGKFTAPFRSFLIGKPPINQIAEDEI